MTSIVSSAIQARYYKMNRTNIAWTNYTWNPITGCTAVSSGCKNCYAKAVHERFYDTPFSEIVFHEDRLDAPRKKKKGKMIFVGSMTDLFHDNVSFEWLYKIWVVMMMSPQHTFQILTKRPDRMKEFLDNYAPVPAMTGASYKDCVPHNIWLGTTIENQKEISRARILINIPAAVHFISVEPMVGEVDFSEYYLQDKRGHHPFPYLSESAKTKIIEMLDWVIVGGESGAKSKVREMKPEWVQKIYDDCKTNSVPFFFKQWGAHKPSGSYDFENIQQFP